jgi:hypothetical protein
MKTNRHPMDYRRHRFQSSEDLHNQVAELDRLLKSQLEERERCTCGGIYESEAALSCPVHQENARRTQRRLRRLRRRRGGARGSGSSI